MNVIVTCDALPLPPLNGHNRKTYDLLRALGARVSFDVIVYPANEVEWERLSCYWKDSRIRLHRLARRSGGKMLRVLWNRHSIPMATRDFDAEYRLITRLREDNPCSLTLIDFLYGSPLVVRLAKPVIISGHDCMSRLFREEALLARGAKQKLVFHIREYLAELNERRYFHIADVVHVVSEDDSNELRRLDNRIKTHVIPIGGEMPDGQNLKLFGERQHKLIWGNINSPNVQAGLRQLFSEALLAKPDVLDGYFLLGKAPFDEAIRLFPEIPKLGIKYVSQVNDISDFLGNCKYVILADSSGTGQKNRTMDALAHGCCVFGTDEVFRGIPSRDSKSYFNGGSTGGILRDLQTVDDSMAAQTGVNGRALFSAEFSLPVLGGKWQELFESTMKNYK